MAEQYTTETVLQHIPKALLNPVDILVLEELGMESEESARDTLYLFREDFPVPEWPLSRQQAQTLAEDVQQHYPRAHKRPHWVERLHAEVERIQGLEDGEHAISFDEMAVDAYDILSSILSKPENSGPDALEAIEIQAGYWCSEARPSEFGGYVVRITAKDIDILGTDHLLDMMRKGNSLNRVESLDTWEDLVDEVPVLNEPVPGDELFESVVVHDATCSARVQVFAKDPDEARERMTDPELAGKVRYELDEGNTPYAYELPDPDNIVALGFTHVDDVAF